MVTEATCSAAVACAVYSATEELLMVSVQVAVFAETVGAAQVLLWVDPTGNTEVVMVALSRWVPAGMTDAVMVKTWGALTALVAVCGVMVIEASMTFSGSSPQALIEGEVCPPEVTSPL